jgi:hypothetical protein
MLVLFNLDRFSDQPKLDPWWAFLGLSVALPAILLGGAYQWRRRRQQPEEVEVLRQQEILSEAEEVELP